MKPTIDHYVAGCTKSMREVVIPAIPANDSFALEQAHLILGLLGLIGEQWDKTYELEHVELNANLRLVRELVGAAQGGARVQVAVAEANRLCESFSGAPDAVASQDSLQKINHSLRSQIARLLEAGAADGTHEFIATCRREILSASIADAHRGRVWFAKTQLDGEWSTLPPLQAILC